MYILIYLWWHTFSANMQDNFSPITAQGRNSDTKNRH